MKEKTKMSLISKSDKVREHYFRDFFHFLLQELKPKGKLITPFNIGAAFILIIGLALIIYRFYCGLSSVTNLSQEHPWGIWIGFDVMTGVAFAGGAYVLSFMVYILHLYKYKPIIKIAILNGFLAYCFYAGALLLDLGRPWNVINPIIGNSFGVSSVMFMVGWHFLLYTMVAFIEFSPVIAEWFGYHRLRTFLSSLTIATVIFGVTIATLHQAGLGGLFLMTKAKLHPLWFTEFIPVLFFISSIFAGLAMVIFEGSISIKVFRHRINPGLILSHAGIVIGLARVAAGTLFVYAFLQLFTVINNHTFSYLNTKFGYWYLTEILGFVVTPCLLFTIGVRVKKLSVIKIASILTLLGVIINRLNISVIAFNWQLPEFYYPSWQEIWITLSVITIELVVLRFVVNRMPVFSESTPTHGKNSKSNYNLIISKEERTDSSWQQKQY